MATLPPSAHGDILPIVKIASKFEGKGDARHIVGAQITALLLFDNCTQVPITIPGLDVAKLPTSQDVTEHNMKMDFLKARFTELVINFSGGDYGAIRYSGIASGVEFLASGK